MKKRVIATVTGFIIAILTSFILTNEYKSLEDRSRMLDNWAVLTQAADIVAPSFDDVIYADMDAKLSTRTFNPGIGDMTESVKIRPGIDKRRQAAVDPADIIVGGSTEVLLEQASLNPDEALGFGEEPGAVETSTDASLTESRETLEIVLSDPAPGETILTEKSLESVNEATASLSLESTSTTASVSTPTETTFMPAATAKPTAMPAATTKATTAPAPTAVPTVTPKPTVTAVPTATPRPTAVPTATPRPTAVPTATPRPTTVPTAAPTAVPQAPVSGRTYAPVRAKNSQEPTNTKIINNSVPGYQIETYANPTQADINHWISVFRNVPEWIKPAQTIRVVIVEGNAGHLYYGGGTWGSILGFTHVDSAAIYVSGNTRHATTAVHETAHVYDFYSGYHSYQDSFNAIYAAEASKLPNNLKQNFNQFEFFAEGVAQYIFNNAAVKSATPRLHQYITNIKG